MTPFDDFTYLINHVLLGEEPTIEDFILLIGTIVAFVAFVLWCCFPIQPKEANVHQQFTCKSLQQHSPSSSFSTTQNNYSKNGSSSNGSSICSPNYALKNGHSYHYCT